MEVRRDLFEKFVSFWSWITYSPLPPIHGIRVGSATEHGACGSIFNAYRRDNGQQQQQHGNYSFILEKKMKSSHQYSRAAILHKCEKSSRHVSEYILKHPRKTRAIQKNVRELGWSLVCILIGGRRKNKK